jgi:hypothetical protein
MPIPLPNLDDRTFAELTVEATTLIPSLQPAWTNHNPSDPGIVLVELLAWLTEMLLFQVNEIPAATDEKFLQLLNAVVPAWTRPEHMSLDKAIDQIMRFGGDSTSPSRITSEPMWVRPQSMNLEEMVGRTIRDLRERYRAVTPEDYEQLALYDWPRFEAAADLGSAGKIRRVRCVPRRNLGSSDPAVRAAPAPADVSLIVVPEPEPGDKERHLQPTPELCNGMWSFFEPRRTLATHHHVVGPTYVQIEVAANLALHEDAPPATALAARQALEEFFDPLSGGPDRMGWPFGRDVYASEVYAVLDQVQLVNYVEDVRVSGPIQIKAQDGSTVGIKLDVHELVQLKELHLVIYDANGRVLR